MSDLMLEILKDIQSRLGGVESRLGGVESRLGGVEGRLDAMDLRLESFERAIGGLRQDMRLMRGALNDIARDSVTPGEIVAVHRDLTRQASALDDHGSRIGVLERWKPERGR